MKLASLALLAVFSTLAASATAQDPLLRLVPADCPLVCWLDTRALPELVGSDLQGAAKRQVRVDVGSPQQDNAALERFAQQCGFDPCADVESIAILGMHAGRGILVLRTTRRVDGIVARLAELGALQKTTSGGLELSRILPKKLARALGTEEATDADDGEDAKSRVYVHRLDVAAAGNGRVLLFGKDAAELASVAKTMLQRDAAERREDVLPAEMRPGCLVFVAVRGPLTELIGDDPKSKIVSKAIGFLLQLSDHDGQLRLTAKFETASVRDAGQVAAVVNGVKALAMLVAPDDAGLPEEVVEALQNAQARVEDKAVTLDASLGSALARKALRDLGRDHGGRAQPAREAEKTGDK